MSATVEPRPAAPRSPRSATMAIGRSWRGLGPARWILLMLVGLVVVFSVIEPHSFPTSANFTNIAVDASVLLVLAVGQTFVIATAGIDLSVGSVLVFSGVVAAKAMNATGWQGADAFVLGVVVAVLVGAAWGLLNGFLVAWAKVPPLIATLGTMGAALGGALLMTGGLDVNTVPGSVTTFGTAEVLGRIPALVVVAVAITLGAAFALNRMRFGRHTLAIGSNPEAVRRAGVHVTGHLIRVYAWAGALAGLAGFLSLARFATTSVNGHLNDNLQAITAVAIGGTSLFGGIASMLGSTVGVLIPSVLNNGFVVSGVQPFWQQIAVGAVLVIAVYLDQRRRARRS